MIKYRRVNIVIYIVHVASTKAYFTLSLGANGILDLSNKNSPHRELLGNNAFDILREKYPPSFTLIDIFEDMVDVSGIEKVITGEIYTGRYHKSNQYLLLLLKKAKIDISSARAYANKKENTAKGFKCTIYDIYIFRIVSAIACRQLINSYTDIMNSLKIFQFRNNVLRKKIGYS